jgi:hypothetical protein
MKKTYTEPQIFDYGSITEMTAGQSYHVNADHTIVTGNNLQHESTGPCYTGGPAPCKAPLR